MRRTSPIPGPRPPLLAAILPLVLAACGPPPEEFTAAYRDALCEAYEDECDTTFAFAACRARGFPSELVPLDPTGCTYRRGTAARCLDLSRWTCEEDDAGVQRVLVRPEACDEVWDCTEAD